MYIIYESEYKKNNEVIKPSGDNMFNHICSEYNCFRILNNGMSGACFITIASHAPLSREAQIAIELLYNDRYSRYTSRDYKLDFKVI